MTEKSCLTVDVRPGESLKLDALGVQVQLIHKSGQAARLRVTAPADVKIVKDTEVKTGR